MLPLLLHSHTHTLSRLHAHAQTHAHTRARTHAYKQRAHTCARVQVETPLERKAKMRARVEQLRHDRETARKAEADRLREEHFIQNCEPVRTLQSKKHSQAAAANNQLLVEHKQVQKQHERQSEPHTCHNLTQYLRHTVACAGAL